MRLKKILVVFSLVLLFAPIYAQEEELPDGWYYGKLIKSVSFSGLKHVSTKDVEGVTSGFIGKKFDDDVFEDMYERIYSLDLFDDVTPNAIPGDSRNSTVSIVFTVTERPIITRLIFQGNRQIRTTEIKDKVSIKEKDVYVESRALQDERSIRDLYLEKGYTNIRVSSSTKETEKGIELTFVINEGRSTVISKIDFRGNKVVSSKTLKSKISHKEVGLFQKGAFQESNLEADKQAIVTYYRNIGYIDSMVVDVTRETAVNESKNRDELTITFVVQEGSQYTYNGISFTGNKIFPTEKLSPLIKLKQGAVFNETKFNEGVMAIADLYYENGYTSNRFNPLPTKDVDNKTIAYELQIFENVRSHVESVVIKGNTKTKDYVIRREIPLESGDVFSKAKVMTGMRNLYNLQYFSAIVPDIVPGSEENLVNLVLTVDEQSTTSIEFGVTFSGVTDPDELPFALFVKWQDSNVKGTGKTVNASTSISTTDQTISVGYGENWFFGQPISSSISAEFGHSSLKTLRMGFLPDGRVNNDSYYMDYEQYHFSLGLSLARRWTPDWAILSWSGGITGSLKNNIYNSDLWVPVDAGLPDYANKWGWSNGIWTAFSVDDRDINYDPSKGWFASQRFTWFGITPWEDKFYLRTETKLEKYFTLFSIPITEAYNLRLILSLYSGISMLFPTKNTALGDTNRLYLDGMFNARGWTDIYRKDKGKAMWSNIIELRLPVVPGILAVDGFFDFGVIKKEVRQIFNSLSWEDFYYSVGPGIRFLIPQFPLRLLFANTFKIVDGKTEWHDHWKFTLSFNIVNK